jgi:nicotinamidase-related amidase
MRALLLVDVIKDFEHEDGDRLLASFRRRHGGLTRAMVEARRRGDLVAFANDGGRDWDVARLIRLALDGKAGELVRAVLPRDTEPVFLKAHYSAFEGTPVAAALDGLGVTELALAGTATEMCVFQTAADALRHGFQVSVLADACASVDERHEALALAYLSEVRRVEILSQHASGTPMGRLRFD